MNFPASLPKTALVLLVLASLAASFSAWQTARARDAGSEAIANFESRLEGVRAALPFQRGVIGYLGEWDVPGIDTVFNDQQAEYLLAQNALAPLILQRGAGPEWTAAVLGKPALDAWQAAHPNEFEIVPLGRGVYLLHRQGSQ